MRKKTLFRSFMPICLALAIIGSILLPGCSSSATNTDNDPIEEQSSNTTASSFPQLLSVLASLVFPESKITSDGLVYTLSSLLDTELKTELSQDQLLPTVGDRETLLKLLLERGVLYDGTQPKYYIDYDLAEVEFTVRATDDAMPAEASMDTNQARAPMALAEEDSGTNGLLYSETNEQVAGVSEGDIVKTDGKHIFAMSPYGGTIRIIRANEADLEVISTITYDSIMGTEFYLIGEDRLAIIGTEYVPTSYLPVPHRSIESANSDNIEISYETDDIAPYDIEPGYIGWYSQNFTILLIYDISDRANPTEYRRISMDGWNVSTRVVGDVVYLVTNKNMWSIPYSEANSPSILPYLRDSAAGEDYEPLAFDCIYYIPDTTDSSYMLIGAVDVYSDDPFSPTAYLGAGSNMYMSQNAMYVTKTRYSDTRDSFSSWQTWRELTDILRFSINGSTITYTGMGTVDGSPINQYSMDEHKGFFRIATTDWNAGTYVTTLHTETMETVGRTDALAPGERMQSSRFMGDMAYVVTFENMDPLFTIDLSDPYNPKILGELKIPGFSQYLHPVGDGLMLGIGRDTQELYTRDSSGVETIVGFRDVGMKISLFDVSDPFSPKEIDTLPLGEGWAEVSNNPRALMSDRSRNIFGFMIESWSSRWALNALLIRVENGRLSIAASLDLTQTSGEYASMYASRLCFIGNTLYLVHENGIEVYDYANFARLGALDFK